VLVYPTMILSDINMPGMDGLTLLQQVMQRFPDLPVMMITAYGDDERHRRASEYGAATRSPASSSAGEPTIITSKDVVFTPKNASSGYGSN
jgi:CheY-like chemotaxis protein